MCGEQLPIKTYTTADGLARNRVECIVEDPRGFLWFCAGGLLSRFDGYTFTNYEANQGVVRKNNSALRISRIRAIGSDVRSTLRIGRIADVT